MFRPCGSQAFEQSFEAPFASGRKDLWGANSRVLALFPVDWDLSGVITAIEEVNNAPARSILRSEMLCSLLH